MAAVILSPIQLSTITTTMAKRGNSKCKKKAPPLFITTNPSHIDLHSLTTLYHSCTHSPLHLAPAAIDTAKLRVAVANSAVVVAVFGGGDGGGGLFGRVTPENGELVGFGRAVSDMALTAAIYDVMVIPPLRRMGIGRKIVQQIIRLLTNRCIYDISALCSESERLFFEACGFGDDILGSTTMMYTRTSSKLDNSSIVAQSACEPSVLPYPS